MNIMEKMQNQDKEAGNLDYLPSKLEKFYLLAPLKVQKRTKNVST